MNNVKLFAAAVMLSAVALTPGLAEARIHHRHHHYGDYDYRDLSRLPYPISYLHNYGPGVAPGSFAYYDGPSTNHCYQGSSAYIGQDRRRHPCF
jgi:hypothetical protein